MSKEQFIIKGVQYFCVTKNNKKHCEAHRFGCTGHGETPVEALIDLHEKLKNKKINKSIYNPLLN